MRRPAPYEPPAETLPLLRSCLATSEEPRTEDWARLTDLPNLLRRPSVTRAALMPQLLHAAKLAGIPLDSSLRSLCRAARVHEELRLAALGPSLGNALAALGGRPVVLRGVALGHTVYDHPALRHCHDIDLLVPRDAVTAIGDGGFPVSGHRRLLAVAPVQVGWAEVLGETIEIQVEGVTAHALSPSIELIGVCVHAATSGRPHSLLWTIDAALLIRAGNVAWEGVVNQAREWRVDSHAAKTLAWLRAHLDVPVPPEVVAALRTRRRRPGPVRRWWPSRAPELSR